MAISSGIFFSTSSPRTLSFFKPSPTSLLVAVPPLGANLRTLRTVTYAAVSSSSSSSSSQQQERRPRGIMKPRPVSPEMAELVGASEIPRTQALKRIWAHIKENNLQDPENKKIVVCDEKLKKIFGGRDSVGFLEIAGLITPHFLK
ncbi:upstream activation factor subunit UAF30-like [Mercurialis annua]|uniref:upstream activation factor subunit UAF30-like n=1 Tax=Mercurialis annua TaxID=3986 RepID=UPI00215DF0FF|nr:upstream activation factor subunit UAF30-like [Mercurialis annua]